MCGRQIYWVINNPVFKTFSMTEPYLPLALRSFYADTTWVSISRGYILSTETTRTKFHFKLFGILVHCWFHVYANSATESSILLDVIQQMRIAAHLARGEGIDFIGFHQLYVRLANLL